MNPSRDLCNRAEKFYFRSPLTKGRITKLRHAERISAARRKAQNRSGPLKVSCGQVRKGHGQRAGQKHLGAYFDKGNPSLERVAILRTRLDMTNSELIKHALDELWKRHG